MLRSFEMGVPLRAVSPPLTLISVIKAPLFLVDNWCLAFGALVLCLLLYMRLY